MIRVLIVDDERRARAYLARLVAEHHDVEVVGEARDGLRALAEIERLSPDLVFLDVQMPEMTGLEVARALPADRAPLVVFTTAYDRYALDAFEVSATDYLLKPYDGERLARALDRARAYLRGVARGEGPAVSDRLERLLAALEGKVEPPAEPIERTTAGPLTRIPAQTRTGIVLLEVGEVYQIASDDRLVFAHTREGRFLLNFSIKDLESRLPCDAFFRSHRSCLVNLRHVREVVPWFHGKLMLKLDDGSEAMVSEDRAPRLRAVLGMS
jgi:DNA-binding LytR/AlgR family response regulator